MEFHFLDQDEDGHWYVIPVAHKEEWDEWCDIPSDDERAWEALVFANRLGGGTRGVIFTQYVEIQQ